MLKHCIFLYLFCAFNLQAQVLDNTEGKTFGDVPFFNEEFIRRNKVKTIKGFYSTKATLDYIRKSKDIYYYEFNDAGQLIKDFRTQYGDTLISMYAYNEAGKLTVLRKSDRGGFHSYHFKYDERGRILTKEYRRDINKSGGKLEFKLDKTYFVSEEKFEYTELEGLNYKKVYYNSAGRIYKDEFFYFEENGYLIKQEGRLKMGSGVTYTTYTYDEMGRVKEKVEVKRIMGNSTSKWVYTYDALSNIMSQHYYKNEKHINELQIVYFQDSYLLEAFITKDIETSLLTILEFSDYTFFK